MRSQIQAASSRSSAKSRAIMSPRSPLLVTSPHHRLRQPIASRDALGDRAPDLDDALARAEVLGERDLPDAGVAVAEGDDVGDLAAAPLVDRLVVVADDAQVRAELRQAADQSLLQRVDVLVLVDDDVSDVVADVLLDNARALIVARRHPRGTAPRG